MPRREEGLWSKPLMILLLFAKIAKMDHVAWQAEEGKGEHYELEVEDLRAELALTFNLVEFKIVNISYNTASYSEITGSRLITNMLIMQIARSQPLLVNWSVICIELSNYFFSFPEHK
jgi:hypothetical protein